MVFHRKSSFNGLRDRAKASTKWQDEDQARTKGLNKALSNRAQNVPTMELKDHKVWQIEFHKDNRDIKVQTDIKQSVYVYRCENSVVQIKGKVNSVTVDSCKKTSVVFDSLLSQVEVINSQSVEVQSLGALPTISIQTVPEQFKFKITFDAAGNKLKTEILDIA